jgi:hypothetical protein
MFFPIAAREAGRGCENAVDERWIARRKSELLGGAFDGLLSASCIGAIEAIERRQKPPKSE